MEMDRLSIMRAVPSIIQTTQVLGKFDLIYIPSSRPKFADQSDSQTDSPFLFFSLFHFFIFSHSSSDHHPAFGAGHAALSMLGNFMGVPNLQNMQQHSDVLEKLKMQVGLMDPEFSLQTLRNLSTPPSTAFTLPPSNSVSSNGTSSQAQNLAAAAPSLSQNSFSFTPPTAPHTKDGNCFVFFSFRMH